MNIMNTMYTMNKTSNKIGHNFTKTNLGTRNSVLYEILAPAKINLFLRILGTREDGYHELYSLFQEIDLADELKVELICCETTDKEVFQIETKSGLCEVGEDLKNLPSEKHLCYKAFARYMDAYRAKCNSLGIMARKISVKATLVKNIPSEAGLGGGSSDAAAILIILQDMLGNPLNEEELKFVGSKIGADVPFFLVGGTCLCSGIGDRVEELSSLEGISLKILKNARGVSTPECFKFYDSFKVSKTISELESNGYGAFLEELRKPLTRSAIDVVWSHKDLLVNDLSKPAIILVPEIEQEITDLFSQGAKIALMSGSGSSAFGLF